MNPSRIDADCPVKPFSGSQGVAVEQEFRSPFDVNHVVIRRYTHLGPDVGYDEVIRMQKVLVGLIGAIELSRTSDSPVYIYVPGLPPNMMWPFICYVISFRK
jgi:hypothetical protein